MVYVADGGLYFREHRTSGKIAVFLVVFELCGGDFAERFGVWQTLIDKDIRNGSN